MQGDTGGWQPIRQTPPVTTPEQPPARDRKRVPIWVAGMFTVGALFLGTLFGVGVGSATDTSTGLEAGPTTTQSKIVTVTPRSCKDALRFANQVALDMGRIFDQFGSGNVALANEMASEQAAEIRAGTPAYQRNRNACLNS